MSELVTAIWEGPFVAEIGWPPRAVQPGDEAQVTEADLESSHWRRKDEPKPKRSRKGKSAPQADDGQDASASDATASDGDTPAGAQEGDS